MELSDELISQFVDISKSDSEIKYETTVKGTIRVVNDNVYVKIDGSDLLTPVSTIADVEDGERVNVVIKDHSAMVTGNMSSPAARTDTVQTIGNTLVAANARISNLEVNKADVTELNAEKAKIIELQANKADISDLNAEKAKIVVLEAFRVEATDAVLGFARVSDLDATNARINNLGATYATIVSLDAVKADVQDLEANKLDVDEAEITYANIDFANIDMEAVTKIFADSGIIDDLVVKEGHITGRLVGVTIIGDLIDAGTVKADKLVVLGSDGLYYKLNTDGESISAQQTEYNSLNGGIITANTITAEKVNVSDLVAFDATIGGFHITNNSLYSGVKASIDNTTTGVYLDSNGQINFGDANNYVKYYILHDEDIGEDVHKLLISADSIMFSVTKKTVDETIESLRSEMIDQTNLENALSEYPKNSDVNDTIDNKLSQYVTNSDIDQANFITEGDLIEMDFLTKGVLNDYIRFSEEGIELGSRDNPLILKINEDRIEFINNGDVVSYWDGNYFHTGNIEVDVTERARFGNFAFVPRTDGSLSFLKINNS